MAKNFAAAGNVSEVSVAAAFSSSKPWLVVEAPKANDAVQFYEAAFGAEELNRTIHLNRKAEQDTPLILWSEIKIGSMTFILSDNTDHAFSPVKEAPAGSTLILETDDVDAAFAKAVAAGAVPEGEVSEGGVWGVGRMGKVRDPYGHAWVFTTPLKNCIKVAAVEPSI